jgi:hypothetical protein
MYMSRRQIGLLGMTEEVTGDLVAWALLLLSCSGWARWAQSSC